MVAEKLTDIVIDDMRTKDIAEVAAIERDSFSTPWSDTSFFNELKNTRSHMKVARIGEKIAGYVCTSHIFDEGHILTLAVRREFRRKGVAEALVGGAIDYLRSEECRFIYLEVRVSNGGARSLYEKFGFRMLGTRKNYYILPVEDALLMVLKLGE